MTDMPRWVLVLLLAVCILGLLVWARGLDHQRGDDVGAHPALTASTAP